MAEGQKRAEIKYGMNVGIVLKEDQSTGYIPTVKSINPTTGQE
jgi:uncharacterized protein YwbE